MYYLGEEEQLGELDLSALIPDTSEYITYDGSLTTPGCQVQHEKKVLSILCI